MAELRQTNEAPDEETGQDSITASLDNVSKQIVGKTKEKSEAVQGAAPGLEQWNRPRINIYRYLATLYSFVIMGMNDAAYGALIPYLETFYDVNFTIISLVFLAPFVGYTLAAILNNKIHMRFGQLGVATIAPMCKIIAYVGTCVHPSYPLLPILFMLAGFGNGLEDGGWNSWIGNMENANQLLGLLHGAYGAGGTISPLIATAMVTKGHWPWYTFYYMMVGLAVTELLVCTLSFRQASGAIHRAASARNDFGGGSTTREALKNHITWICAFFLLCYVGVEVALGGWIVTFMLQIRDGEPFQSGFFLGPLFPAAIIVATKVLPKHLHISAIGFAAAFGGGGGACFVSASFFNPRV
ncbi:Bypass of stop codon protein [Lachnellula occidentalis]|uniref:Bypass of stop codon protein n=1 Tax=Lachnellula occidentalis TaxID=215460 RepID=A0A8H8S3K5_9HELO|nr:Bypass of stop codon protein [Lachnellula occidentalis]